MDSIELYTYCKSSAAYRVRIALNLKNINYTSHYVSLVNEGGENFRPEYRSINPQAMVPSLKVNNEILTQSTAIVEWLEENYPVPALLPSNSMRRARARSLAQIVACDIHPLNNLRVLDYLKNYFPADDVGVYDEAKLTWYRHWIHEGFDSIENFLSNSLDTGEFCFGDTPSIADVYLIPQIYNAKRFHCELSGYPTILRIHERCAAIDAFLRAAPEHQQDFA